MKAGTPATARDFLRCLRLSKYATSIGVRQDDPTAGVQVKMPKSDGYKTRPRKTLPRSRTPIPSAPRNGLPGAATQHRPALRRCRTGQTPTCAWRHDLQHQTAKDWHAAAAHPHHCRIGGRHRRRRASEHVVFLVNERGKAFNAKGFGEWFSKQCRRAGLKGLSAHGLRKAACRRLAENGPVPARSPPSVGAR